MRTHPKNPGDLVESDFAAYKPVEREPVCGDRLGHRVCGMPPPSSGGIAVLQALTFTEDLVGKKPLVPASAHRFAESGRLVFADRARYLADPAFVDVPVKALLDPAYLAMRAQVIRSEIRMGRADAGELPAVLKARVKSETKVEETPLWDHPVGLPLFFGILSTEWIVRRKAGLP